MIVNDCSKRLLSKYSAHTRCDFVGTNSGIAKACDHALLQ